MSSTDQPAKPSSGDPAMDDILASIRRILNEDETPAAATAPQGAAAAEPLDLTEDMLVTPPQATPETPPVMPAPEPVAAVPSQAPEPAPAPTPAPAPALAPDTLLAPAVAAAATAAVGQLLRTVANERGAAIHRGGPTIEDVVREELRPLLKEWLDLHLQPLVERLVRAEIERVVGRALP